MPVDESPDPVTVVAAIRVRAGVEARARDALERAVAPTLQEPGCLAYELHQSTTDPAEFMFYERWSSEAALAAHASSTAPHRALLRQELGELADGRPIVTRWRRVDGV
jgi:quinol monooxygenase YgiN